MLLPIEFMFKDTSVMILNFDEWLRFNSLLNCDTYTDLTFSRKVILAIVKLTFDKEKVNKLGVNGRNMIKNRFNLQQEARKHNITYKGLLNGC